MLHRRTDDAWVLLARHGDDPVLLEGTAARIWDLLELPSTLDDLVALFAAATGHEEAAIAQDVLGFLEQLEEQELAERV